MKNSDFITIKIRRSTYGRWKLWLAERIGQTKKIEKMQDFLDRLEPGKEKENECNILHGVISKN